MRISDWSSDVCSSDLVQTETRHADRRAGRDLGQRQRQSRDAHQYRRDGDTEQQGKNQNRSAHRQIERGEDRKSVVEGKSVAVRVDLGGRRIIKKQQLNNNSILNQK